MLSNFNLCVNLCVALYQIASVHGVVIYSTSFNAISEWGTWCSGDVPCTNNEVARVFGSQCSNKFGDNYCLKITRWTAALLEFDFTDYTNINIQYQVYGSGLSVTDESCAVYYSLAPHDYGYSGTYYGINYEERTENTYSKSYNLNVDNQRYFTLYLEVNLYDQSSFDVDQCWFDNLVITGTAAITTSTTLSPTNNPTISSIVNCQQSAICQCPASLECIFNCEGSSQCAGATFQTQYNGQEITINCIGSSACFDASGNLPSAARVIWNCQGAGACNNAHVSACASDNSNCNLNCLCAEHCENEMSCGDDYTKLIDDGSDFECIGLFCITPAPTQAPTDSPSTLTQPPTLYPTIDPTKEPTADPTENPTPDATVSPTITTIPPTSNPTTWRPTRAGLSRPPTMSPTQRPTIDPTKEPTKEPTADPTENPTNRPTRTRSPTPDPTRRTFSPTQSPSQDPTYPTASPTGAPSGPSVPPTPAPSDSPTTPSIPPTPFPSLSPTTPTTNPTKFPTESPTYSSTVNCKQSQICTCPPNDECIFNCRGDNGCVNTEFVAAFSGQKIEINCYGSFACYNSTGNLSSAASVIWHCRGNNACSEAYLSGCGAVCKLNCLCDTDDCAEERSCGDDYTQLISASSEFVCYGNACITSESNTWAEENTVALVLISLTPVLLCLVAVATWYWIRVRNSRKTKQIPERIRSVSMTNIDTFGDSGDLGALTPVSPSNSEITTCYDRIVHVLELAKELDENKNHRNRMETNNGDTNYMDIYDCICVFYKGKGGLKQFYCDYHEFINKMDDEDHYESYDRNICKCNIKDCRSITRNWRDQTIFDANNEERLKLYRNSPDENSVVVQQTVDILHIVVHHLEELGLRNNSMENGDNENRFEVIGDRITKKLTVGGEDETKNNSNLNVSTGSKFMTHIHEDDDDKNEGNDYPLYSSGIRYFYHDYFRENETGQDIIPGTRVMELGNSMMNGSYKFGTWYIPPKYDSLKTEILHGAKNKLTMIQWHNTLQSTTYKFKAFSSNVRRAIFIWEKVYNIKKDSPITLSHLLAITFYTDHTEISREFTESYRKLSSLESDSTLRSRHQTFGHWARKFRETIEVWGTYMKEAPNYRQFYHGITKRMVFAGFKQRFCSPTSCTLSLDVAAGFARQSQYGDGIVITIRNDRMGSPFFDCKPWSRFPWEYEVVFVGGCRRMEICGLTTISDGKEYNLWVKSIQMFQTVMIDGSRLTQQVEKINQIMMNELVEAAVANNEQNEDDEKQVKDTDPNEVPNYALALFENIVHKIKVVSINTGYVNHEYLHADKFRNKYHGGLLFKHLHFNDDDTIKWNIISELYKSITTIYIGNKQNEDTEGNEYQYLRSVSVSCKFMDKVISFLGNIDGDQFNGLIIEEPDNSLDELKEIQKTYVTKLQVLKFKIFIKDYKHPQYGQCTRFYIRHERMGDL